MCQKEPQLLFSKDKSDWTGLHHAAWNDRVFAMKWLIDKKLNIDEATKVLKESFFCDRSVIK
jgi:ankyrin repeat protein